MGTVAVSVVVPIYNAESYLGRCLKSICAQTLENIEIICVNDASQDASLEIIKSFQQLDSRIKCIDLKQNGGESHARNVGMAQASGEYIGSVDNDDFIDVNFFEELYKKAKSESCDIVKGNCVSFQDDKLFFYPFENENVLKDKYNFFCRWWTAIYRTSLIQGNHIVFPEDLILGGDLIFLYTAIKKCKKISVVNDTLYHYIRRPDSGDSTVLSSEKVASVLNAYERISQIYNDLFSVELSDHRYVRHYFRMIEHILEDIVFQCSTSRDQYLCLASLRTIFENSQTPELLVSKTTADYSYSMIFNLLKDAAYEKLLTYLITKRKLRDTLNAIKEKKRAARSN